LLIVIHGIMTMGYLKIQIHETLFTGSKKEKLKEWSLVDFQSKKKLTLPTKAALPPSLAMPTATLAGAPPGAFLNAGASANDTPPTVGTKSINISPKQTTRLLPCSLLTERVDLWPRGAPLGVFSRSP
jgi:hypothetical protein